MRTCGEQGGAEAGAGAAEAAHDGAGGDGDEGGDFFIAVVFDVGEPEDAAEFGGEGGESGGEDGGADGALDGSGGGDVGGLAENEARVAAAEMGQAVEEDGEEPGAAVGAGLETAEGAPGLEENFLREILGGVRVAEQGAGGAGDIGAEGEGFGFEAAAERRVGGGNEKGARVGGARRARAGKDRGLSHG